ncbi:hypothetical protein PAPPERLAPAPP_00950 [Brevundimonas phage vB_BpoS-Papperlapapp]|uniref:Uncharacterized protein n=2 Tax=Marchewkavirus TaxID=3425052 RepID=A0A9E7MRD4_9CAUD|nr:hypothetical protein KABACHOK_05180 [Brevundimonas phage vB_BpoS-Kabachok]USN15023.1 hypothetical protein DOMOVOI_05730 [Brevundimonas phage vB_BpoS-Domovoi]USN15837.1 hypothetical protein PAPPERLAPAPP_00950 [Brevundimonas phage vB_BpoS-Papperlapapp]
MLRDLTPLQRRQRRAARRQIAARLDTLTLAAVAYAKADALAKADAAALDLHA